MRAHFQDPAYYASAYADRVDDVAYYRSVARGVGRVLEYGIGNGRIALPIAQAGSHVTGVDLSKEMLADLAERIPPKLRDRIELVRGDMRTVELGKKFPLVLCPFNTALHLYTRRDVERWLERVRGHLTRAGTLVFDVSTPSLPDLMREPGTPYRTPPFEHPSLGRVSYREHFDYDRARQILFVSMFFDPPGIMIPLAHRQFFPQEVEALLHYNGFAITDLFGDFQRGPFTGDSDVMVFHARKRPAR